MDVEKVVIVGGGNAGLQIADSIRRGGFQGSIDIFCDEEYPPYL